MLVKSNFLIFHRYYRIVTTAERDARANGGNNRLQNGKNRKKIAMRPKL